MTVSSPHDGALPFALDGLAAAVVDNRGTVLRWTATAQALTGFTAGEVCGRHVSDLLAEDRGGPGAAADAEEAPIPLAGRVPLRHRPQGTIDAVYRATPMDGPGGSVILAAPAQRVSGPERSGDLLGALSGHGRIRIALHDTDLAVVQTGTTSAGAAHGPHLSPGCRLSDVTAPEDAARVEALLRQVLTTGVPVVRSTERLAVPGDPRREWVTCWSAVRLEDEGGRPTGVASVFVDPDRTPPAGRHVDLARETAEHVGDSLDVLRTAQELASVLAPGFADLAAVDLAQAVFDGEEPPPWSHDGELLRAAATAPPDAVWTPRSPGGEEPVLRQPADFGMTHCRRGEAAVLGREQVAAALGPRMGKVPLPEDFRSVAVAPLTARGLALGVLSAWRVGDAEPFTAADAALLEAAAARGALALDNARRYTHEHRAAGVLQQRLLPPSTTDTPAAETAGVYLPAGGGEAIGGDWFDAIPLPSFRLALVAGDVVGHGIHASATMGRLRTAIQTLADLELDPEELLTRVGDLVQRLANESEPYYHDVVVGATCLYAVHDPVSGHCTIASAGHPPPILVRPGQPAEVVDVSPGPPFPVGGTPYESTTIDFAPGSILALYTDGLIEQDRDEHEVADIDQGTQRLAAALTSVCRPGRTLAETGHAVLAELGIDAPRDDVALMLARARAIPEDHMASWEFPADLEAVAGAREATARQLASWGLDELAFTTELIVSELVTNAVRHARPPIWLRLIRDGVLVCEVGDSSPTQPRMRRARSTDEGGRGLFIVAQLSSRWGCRYGRDGKTIWAEQPMPQI
ncbi:SpoIIE family protein phosphatase [Streptomyces sp. NPDC020917]|uniref:SpoIIE family protein phosphatase n=1 Tax=Streptomyces sp. NPDC020917 TaxID=3365102 RepID=UPI003790604E